MFGIASGSRRRIGGGKAVTGNPPLAVLAFVKDEELLVAFGTGCSGRVDLVGPCRVRSHELLVCYLTLATSHGIISDV
jgi:hypothetical protein